MTCPPINDDLIPPTAPTLSIDWELYASMLAESDMPLEDQKELVETLWSIAVAFVDMGFDLSPVQQICGESEEALSDLPPDLVSLIEQEMREERP